MSRAAIVAATTSFVLALSACGGGPRTCSPVALEREAEVVLAEEAAELDFEPRPPCVFRSRFLVQRVFLDVLPGDPPHPRVNFVVTHEGTDAFILSQTRAPQPFSAIPQGTHRLRVEAGEVVAAGFAGPSGGGSDLAYLRWRVSDVTFELAATLGPALTERDVQAIARAMIAQDVASLSDDP